MHVDTGILKELQNGEATQGGKIIDPEELGYEFAMWLLENGFGDEVDLHPLYSGRDAVKRHVSKKTFTAAGKNVASFDIPHVRELPNFSDYIQFHHRVLDPGPMYFDPEKDDVVPDLSTCLERAGVDDEVAHTAVEDSLDVCKLVRLDKGVSLD